MAKAFWNKERQRPQGKIKRPSDQNGRTSAEPEALLASANAARDRRDWKNAAKFYEQYLIGRADSGEIWVQLGHSQKETGDLKSAESAYLHAIDLMDDPTDPMLHLGHMLKAAGQQEAAKKYFERIAGLKPKNGEPLAESSGEEQASSRERSEIWLEPEEILSGADAARDRRDWLTAGMLYQKFLHFRPSSAAIWIQLGHARKESGNLLGALAAYERGCNSNVKSVDAQLHLAGLYKRLRRFDEAASAYARGLEFDASATEPFLELVALGRRPLAQATVMDTSALPAPTTRLNPEFEPKGLAIFTIACNNYLSYVRTFVASARRVYPDARIFFCLADRAIDPELSYPEGCEVVLASELGIRRFEDFAFRYDVMEFNTAVKPFVFEYLFANLNFGKALYFDPDIEIFSRSEGVLAALDQGAPFVITPHLLEPAGLRGEPDDTVIMRSGVFNLGFIGASKCEESARLLRWWAEHLQFDCLNDPKNGIFVDQKFIDLLPGFSDGVVIHRNSATNVAYWNLSERDLKRDSESWRVNGRPLEFFHYSGFDPRKPSRLSKHTRLFSEVSGDLAALLASYASQLESNGDAASRNSAYSYGRFASGAQIPNQARDYFRRHHLAWPSDPFKTYEEILLAREGQDPLPRLARHFWDESVWLKQAFDPSSGHGLEGYAAWIEQNAGRDLGLHKLFAQKLARSVRLRRKAARGGAVCAIGYLNSTTGMGEGGRRMVKALAATGRGRQAFDITGAATGMKWECPLPLVGRPSAPIELYVVNADEILNVFHHFGASERPGALRILVPSWELEKFPTQWVPALNAVDAIWASTRFIANSIYKVTGTPVFHAKQWLDFDPQTAEHSRSHFGIPDESFMVYTAFDFLSWVARKNPFATVAAFRRAGEIDCRFKKGATLVMKTSNGAAAEEELLRLHRDVKDLRAIILDARLTSQANRDLTLLADCILSLHRSEGQGLLTSDAMACQIPVIATGYSATAEQLDDGRGYLVEYKMINVMPGEYPLSEGAVWADPDIDHAASLLLHVFHHRAEARERAVKAKEWLSAEHGLRAVAQHYTELLDQL